MRTASLDGHARSVAVVLGAATFAVYASVLGKYVVDCWADPDYSFAFISVPIAAWMIAARRERFRSAQGSPSGWGLLIAVVSLAFFAAGRLGAELFLSRLSLVGFAAGSIVFVGGWRPLRVLALPLLIVALSIPLPAIVMTKITLPLQLTASAAAERVLNVIQIPVFREGNILMLPNTTLEVAQACSGIRSLIALVTLGLLIARTADQRPLIQAAIATAAIPVAVIVNVMRVSITAVGAYWYGVQAAEGLPHEAIGWVMFAVGCGLLWLVAQSAVRPMSRTFAASI